ncbi:cell division control protein 2C [Dorcoceras hygrometricum]|uniref:Cell division control protein 2C n=1 Tax=Dorcoceras hygrometricum TaxID=472368 RepID=A0A2Z7AAE4_9LAMI|nr:cell division control protein 2C [Dorcoceras hygrometricum]
MFTSATSVPFKGNNNFYVSIKRSVQGEQQCLRQQQAFRSRGRAMFTSAASSSVQGEQTCLRHPYMLDSNAYIFNLRHFIHSQSSVMASSSFTNAYLVDFESVLNIPYNEGMQNMFKALENSGLRGSKQIGVDFSDVPKNLVYDARKIFSKSGEPVVPHGKKKLLKYEYRLLNDILAKSIMVKAGSFDDVTNERFQMMTAIHFGLKVNWSKVLKNLVYDARKIFSKSGEPVVPHGKKKLLKYEYRLLNDILAKSIMVKAGSFDDVTNERFQMMTAIHFGLKVNWSKVLFGVLEEMVDRTVKKAKGYGAQISVLLNSDPALTMGEATHFPSSKILSPKTVLTYITTNHTADARGQSDAGGKTPVAIVKRASKLKKKSESTSDATVEIVSEVVGSKKRPAVEGSEPVVPKKRRTTKIKASVSSANMDMTSVAQGAVPIQVIAPTPAVTAAQPPAPKRKSRNRRLILSEGSDDDNVEESIDVASVKVAGVNVEESIEKVSHVSAQVAQTTDEVGVIIGQILTETSKLKTDDTESGEQIFTETDVGDIVFGDSTADNPEELAQWLENYISEGAEQVNESDSDRVQGTVDTVDGEQLFETANVEEAEGSISPVVEKDLAKAVGSKHSAEELISIDDLLFQIPDDMLLPSVTAKLQRLGLGKEILEEDEPVKGNPARETVELICRDVEFLIQLRDRVMKDVVEFFHSFSHNKLSNLDALLELKAKEKLMLDWAETDSLETAVKRKVYILAKYREMLLRKFVESHRKYYTPGQPWTATTSKIIYLLSVAHSKSLEDLIAQQKEHGLPVEQPCTSMFLDASVGSGAVLAQFYSMAKSTCWVRPLVFIDGVWTPIQGTDFWRSSCKLSLFVNRKKFP